MKKVSIFAKSLFLASFILFGSCSSAPKRSMQISTVYSSAHEMIESANSCILSGDYDKAELFLYTAETQAISIDNYDLLTAVCLTRCSLALSYNPQKIELAQQQVNQAEDFCKNCSDPEKQQGIIALSKVRIELAAGNQNFSQLHNILQENQKSIKGDPFYEAQYLCVHADIYKLEKNYQMADKYYSDAAKSFTDNRYLSEIGICWYKAAQSRSLNGKKDSALEAMENAIFYDRAAENSMALGTDYYAVGLILLKGNPNQNEILKANQAFNRSAQIFNSINQTELAQKSKEAIRE